MRHRLTAAGWLRMRHRLSAALPAALWLQPWHSWPPSARYGCRPALPATACPHSGVSYPCGYLEAHAHWCLHMSSMPYLATQPSSFSASAVAAQTGGAGVGGGY